MTFNEDVKLKKKRVTWKRSMATVAGLVALVGGANLVQDCSAPPAANTIASDDPCDTGDEANASLDCRVEFTTSSLDLVWSKELKEQRNVKYIEPNVVVFAGTVNTFCGTGKTEVGPFYCGKDKTVYIDTAFYQTLTDTFGSSGGPLAQEYVLAHEVGHHIQNQLGVLSRAWQGPKGPDSLGVRTELQADCYAGVWATKADELKDADGNTFLEPITEQDIADALSAAESVGDDNIQETFGLDVNKDTWTHGSSDQREKWFMAGYKSGSMNSCDTYNSPDLNNP